MKMAEKEENDSVSPLSFKELVERLTIDDKAAFVHVVEVHDKYCSECKKRRHGSQVSPDTVTMSITDETEQSYTNDGGCRNITATSIKKTLKDETNDGNSPREGNDLTEHDTLNNAEAVYNQGAQLGESKVERNIKKTERSSKTFKWAIQLFKKWLKDNGISQDLERLQSDEVLQQIQNMTLKKTKDMKPAFPKRIIDVIKFSVVDYLNQTNKKTSKLVPIKQEDLQKIYSSGTFGNLGTYTAISLLYKVWFEINLHFGHFFKRNCSLLKKEELKIATDEKGRLFCTFCLNEMDDTRWRDAPRIYSTPENPFCPLKSILYYITHLNPNCEFLFQHPVQNLKMDGKAWYSREPLSKSTIKNMMKIISKTACLSNEYTNTSISDTTCLVLAQSGLWNEEEYKKKWMKESNYDIAQRKGDIFVAVQKYIHGSCQNIGVGSTFLLTNNAEAKAPTVSIHNESISSNHGSKMAGADVTHHKDVVRSNKCFGNKLTVEDVENVCPQVLKLYGKQSHNEADKTKLYIPTSTENNQYSTTQCDQQLQRIQSNGNRVDDPKFSSENSNGTSSKSVNIQRESNVCTKELGQSMIYLQPKISVQASPVSLEIPHTFFDNRKKPAVQMPTPGNVQKLPISALPVLSTVTNTVQVFTMPVVQPKCQVSDNDQSLTRNFQISYPLMPANTAKKHVSLSSGIGINTTSTRYGNEMNNVTCENRSQSLSSTKLLDKPCPIGGLTHHSEGVFDLNNNTFLIDVKDSDNSSSINITYKYVGKNKEKLERDGSVGQNLEKKVPNKNKCLHQSKSSQEHIKDQHYKGSEDTKTSMNQENDMLTKECNRTMIDVQPRGNLRHTETCSTGSTHKSTNKPDVISITDDEGKIHSTNVNTDDMVKVKDEMNNSIKEMKYRDYTTITNQSKLEKIIDKMKMSAKSMSSNYQESGKHIKVRKQRDGDANHVGGNLAMSDSDDTCTDQLCIKDHDQKPIKTEETDCNWSFSSGSVHEYSGQNNKLDDKGDASRVDVMREMPKFQQKFLQRREKIAQFLRKIRDDSKTLESLKTSKESKKEYLCNNPDRSNSLPNMSRNTSDHLPNVSSNNSDRLPDVSGNHSDRLPDVYGNNSDHLPDVSGNYSDRQPDVSGSNSDRLPNVSGNISDHSNNCLYDASEDDASSSTVSADDKHDNLLITVDSDSNNTKMTPLKLSIRKKEGNQYEIVKSNISRQIIYAPFFDDEPKEHSSVDISNTSKDRQRKRKLDCGTTYDRKSKGFLPCLLPLKRRCSLNQCESSSLNTSALDDFITSEDESDSDCSLTDEPSLLKCVNTKFYNFQDINSD